MSYNSNHLEIKLCNKYQGMWLHLRTQWPSCQTVIKTKLKYPLLDIKKILHNMPTLSAVCINVPCITHYGCKWYQCRYADANINTKLMQLHIYSRRAQPGLWLTISKCCFIKTLFVNKEFTFFSIAVQFYKWQNEKST